jgi:hypothetical protein
MTKDTTLAAAAPADDAPKAKAAAAREAVKAADDARAALLESIDHAGTGSGQYVRDEHGALLVVDGLPVSDDA